jgi:hypothetical protein
MIRNNLACAVARVRLFHPGKWLPPLARLKLTYLAFGGSRKRPFFVPEKFTFE